MSYQGRETHHAQSNSCMLTVHLSDSGVCMFCSAWQVGRVSVFGVFDICFVGQGIGRLEYVRRWANFYIVVCSVTYFPLLVG